MQNEWEEGEWWRHVKRNMTVFIAAAVLFCLALCGVFFFNDRKYYIFSIIAAVVTCVPFFLRFERKNIKSRELIVISVMIALNVASRFIFAPLQSFKPVTAITIITGIYLGSDAGFMTGALTALISNFQFVQGPWTPFQMAVWGLIGFLAGALSNIGLFKRKGIVIVFSGFSGILFSLLMDIWTTVSIDNSFSIWRYFSFVAASIPVMMEYVISNIIFIILLYKPIGAKLERVKIKYGLFGC